MSILAQLLVCFALSVAGLVGTVSFARRADATTSAAAQSAWAAGAMVSLLVFGVCFLALMVGLHYN